MGSVFMIAGLTFLVKSKVRPHKNTKLVSEAADPLRGGVQGLSNNQPVGFNFLNPLDEARRLQYLIGCFKESLANYNNVYRGWPDFPPGGGWKEWAAIILEREKEVLKRQAAARAQLAQMGGN